MKRERICLIIACLLSFALTTGIMERRMEVVHAEIAQTQKTLAEEVFRFHVIAESNSVKDQRIKLHVRDTVLSYMKSQMPETERKSAQLTKDWVKKHQKELVKTADEVLKKEGVSYRAQAKVTSCYFPDKRYGDIIFPEGEYEALRITLGSGKGHNWWCVLYPSLCFTNATCAVVDEDGKKDLTELWEIVLRDLTSSLAVVFAVPMLTRACVTSYEKKSGFVLMQKDRSSQSKLKTSLDLLNPYSKAHVLTNSEINSLYNNIDTKDKMLNFCKYIDKNGGDLQKIISKSEHAEEIFKISSLNGLNKAEKNKKIISLVEKFDKSNADEIIKKLMKAVGKAKSNKITTFARGLTSVPGLLTTFFISPYLLGWFIPRLTYKNTRRIHEKQDREREARRLEKLNSINN